MKELFYEGSLLEAEKRSGARRDKAFLLEAMKTNKIVEGYAFAFDGERNIVVPFCGTRGLIPFSECAYAFDNKEIREVAAISRVGKPVCFTVTGVTVDSDGCEAFLLSRREAQKRYYDETVSRLSAGDVIPCRITHIEKFGCFADIGRGLIALLPIDLISVSRISHPTERLSVGEIINCVIKSVDGDGRIVLSLKELLGTFEENAALFHAGETVVGTVRSVEDYGIFVELTPNLSGLAEPSEGIRVGDAVSVYIKSIIPHKLKVKLSITGVCEAVKPAKKLCYFTKADHIDRFVYSPNGCERLAETVFCE